MSFIKYLQKRERDVEFVEYVCKKCGCNYQAVEMFLIGTHYIDGKECPTCKHNPYDFPGAHKVSSRKAGKLPVGCLFVWEEMGICKESARSR